MNLLEELNDKQYEAVTDTERTMLSYSWSWLTEKLKY